jgi:hypothetical protein
MARLVYNAGVGDWCIQDGDEILDAFSWHSLPPATGEEAAAWFQEWEVAKVNCRWSAQQVKQFAKQAKARYGELWRHVSDDLRGAVCDEVSLAVLTNCIDSTFTAPDITALKFAVRRAAGLADGLA